MRDEEDDDEEENEGEDEVEDKLEDEDEVEDELEDEGEDESEDEDEEEYSYTNTAYNGRGAEASSQVSHLSSIHLDVVVLLLMREDDVFVKTLIIENIRDVATAGIHPECSLRVSGHCRPLLECRICSNTATSIKCLLKSTMFVACRLSRQLVRATVLVVAYRAKLLPS